MRIAFIALRSSGSTFMDWSFNFLTNCNQGKFYSDKTKSWQPTVSDAVGTRTGGKLAHGHQPNHPVWNYPQGNQVIPFLKNCKDMKGTITFYPYVDGSLCVDGEMYDLNKEMIQYLIEQNVKIFSIQSTMPYPYISERSKWTDDLHIPFFQRWLRTDSTSYKELREKISFRLLANAKKTVEDIQQCHTQINPMVPVTFIDTHWQANPEECMKKVCDTLGLDILSEKLIQWRPIADRWIKSNNNINDWYEVKTKEITTAIIENKEMVLPKLDIMGQITIMAYLMRDYGRRLVLPTDDFPLDAQILHGYLK